MNYSSRPRRYCSAVLVLATLACGCGADDSDQQTTSTPSACQFTQDSPLPIPSGSYCVGIRELHWQSGALDPLSPDGARKREIGVRFY